MVSFLLLIVVEMTMSSPKYIDPYLRLRIAKQVTPQIFEGKSPKFHIEVLEVFEARHRLTALAIFRGASKTTIFNKTYVATEIFLNQEPFTQIVSKDSDKAKSFLKDIKSMLMSMQLTGYSILKGSIWRDDFIEVIVNGSMKCVVKAIGAGEDPRGDTADFQRPTLIVIDDLESKVGKYPVDKKKSRDKLQKWVDEDLIPGLHPTKGRLIFMGTILHKYSVLAKALKNKEYVSIDIPIIRNGKLAWASRYPVEAVKKIKELYASQGNPSGFFREFMNKPIADDKVLFLESYFRYFHSISYGESSTKIIKNALSTIQIIIKTPQKIILKNGKSISLDECKIYTTMDVASGSETGDRTAIVTCATDKEGNRYVLECKSGYWNPFEKAVYAIETYLSFKPLVFGIEKGGMQNDFHSSIEVTQKEVGVVLPIFGLEHKGINKNIRIGNMQPSFIAGKIYFDDSSLSTSILESQLMAFDMDSDSEEDDEIDALAYHERFNQWLPSSDSDDKIEEDYDSYYDGYES